jgi:hypothetical protein
METMAYAMAWFDGLRVDEGGICRRSRLACRVVEGRAVHLLAEGSTLAEVQPGNVFRAEGGHRIGPGWDHLDGPAVLVHDEGEPILIREADALRIGLTY